MESVPPKDSSRETKRDSESKPEILRRPRKSQKENIKSDDELTDKDIKLARDTWMKNIDHQQSALGAMIFRELFLSYPELEFFFLHMKKSATDENIFSSPQFRSHMKEMLVPKLKEILDSIDRPDNLTEMMTTLGMYHAELRIRSRHIDDMLEAIVAAIKNITGNKLSKEEAAAIEKSFSKAFVIAIDTVENYRKLNQVSESFQPTPRKPSRVTKPQI